VKNLTNETLLKLIIANVKPEIKIIIDYWLSYMGLQDLGCIHKILTEIKCKKIWKAKKEFNSKSQSEENEGSKEEEENKILIYQQIK